MSKRNAIILTCVVLILGLIVNFLFEIMPDEFQESVAGLAKSIGLSYTAFWIICTLFIASFMLFLVWKQASNETKDSDKENQPVKIKRQINQYGPKSLYIEKNNGDINVK